ncbi:43422_t:CDS:2, partial [Gigaspora margarita]
FKEIKLIHSRYTFQDENIGNSQSPNKERQSYNNNRYSRCFLPSTKTNISVIKEPRYQTHDILGQDSLTSTLKFRGNKSNKIYCTETRRAWFQNQLTKVYAKLTLSQKKINDLRREYSMIIKKQLIHIKKLASTIGRLLATTECTTDTIAPKHPATQLVNYKSEKLEWNMPNRKLTNNNYLHKHIINRMRSILVKSDNTIAVVYLNYQGSTAFQELSLLAEDIWNLCLNKKIRITAQHLPGKLNLQVDQASRYRPVQQDWKLNPTIFNQLMIKWGLFTINLFANRNNTQLPHYFSRFPDPSAFATDALKQKWPKKTLWSNSPWIIIPKILFKMILDK